MNLRAFTDIKREECVLVSNVMREKLRKLVKEREKRCFEARIEA